MSLSYIKIPISVLRDSGPSLAVAIGAIAFATQTGPIHTINHLADFSQTSRTTFKRIVPEMEHAGYLYRMKKGRSWEWFVHPRLLLEMGYLKGSLESHLEGTVWAKSLKSERSILDPSLKSERSILDPSHLYIGNKEVIKTPKVHFGPLGTAPFSEVSEEPDSLDEAVPW